MPPPKPINLPPTPAGRDERNPPGSRRVKVLYLVTLAEMGGAQRYICDLATHLGGGAFEIIVAAGSGGPLLEQLKSRGVATQRIAHLRREISPRHDRPAISEITRLFSELKPDIVHLNSSKAGVLGALAARRAGVPGVVYSAHGFVFNEPKTAGRRWTYRWLERISARWKNRIICVSEADRQSALRHRIAPAHKLITIHNGLDLDRIHFLSKEEARKIISEHYNLQATGYPPPGDLPQGDNLVGTIAHLYPTKGISDLVEAAAIVERQLPATAFVVIGEGRQRAMLEALIRQRGLSEKFHLVGEIPDAARLLAAFDVSCSSSRKEGFPYAVLEAMAAGRPIVATAVGGVPEMIADGREGLLVSAGEPAKLATTIIRLLQDPLFAERLGEAARVRVRREFALQKMVEDTTACYRQLLGS